MLLNEANFTDLSTVFGSARERNPAASCVKTLGAGRNPDGNLLLMGDRQGKQQVISSHFMYITK